MVAEPPLTRKSGQSQNAPRAGIDSQISPMPLRLTPLTALLDTRLSKVAASVPGVPRPNAWPVRVPVSVTLVSRTVNVPKLLPEMPMPVVLPAVGPRMRFVFPD